MTRQGSDTDRIVFIVCAIIAFFLLLGFAYQSGYEAARSECHPVIKYQVPLKQMTHRQQVRNIQWMNRDREVIR